MFSWLQKKSEVKKKQQEAFAFGEQVADWLIAEIDSFFEQRYNRIALDFVRILRDQISASNVTNEDFPPLHLVRAHYSVFLEQGTKLVEEMQIEIGAEMKKLYGTIGPAASPEIVEIYNQLVRSRINDFQLKMLKDGMEVLIEDTYNLKAADNVWRAINLEKAKLYPIE